MDEQLPYIRSNPKHVYFFVETLMLNSVIQLERPRILVFQELDTISI